MESSYPSKLRVWDGPAAAVVSDFTPLNGHPLPWSASPARDDAERLFACEALTPPASGRHADEVPEPYTLQWFLSIENQRHSRQGRWIPRLLEFAKHAGETLLGLGNGLGTDWLQYARHGASVIVCSPSAQQLALIRRNFELRSLGGRFLHSAPTALPLDGNSIDVACVSSLLHEVDDPQAVVEEVYRVLKPGGKVLAVLPARYDVDFWFHTCFWWHRWLGTRFQPPPRSSPGFTGRGLRRCLFRRFVEHRVHKRQLRRSEVPHVWRWLPRPLLERLMGRVLVLKAFKPLSAAIAAQAAA
jgi:SAM-dependent methyltransferase